jgi:hypothetical protein
MSPWERVANRYLKCAVASPRSRARENALPVNPARGIDKDIVSDNAETDTSREEAVKPSRKDIRPEDVFPSTPNNMGVLNLAETGKDLSQAIDKKVPKDEGYDTVRNLSQYLISTEGGGEGGGPVSPKKR